MSDRQDRVHVLDEEDDCGHGGEGQNEHPLERPVEMHVEAHGHLVLKVLRARTHPE